MVYLLTEIRLLLGAEDGLELPGPGGRVLLRVERQPSIPASEDPDDDDRWVVTDYRLHPTGVPHRATGISFAAALVLDLGGAPLVKRLMALRAYRLLFPHGSSLDWPAQPLRA